MQLQDFYRQLVSLIPEETAEDFDRIGIQVQSGVTELRRLLVTMEVTDAVVQEAVERSVDAIISFHPLIFPSIERIIDGDRVGRIVTQLIQHRIALMVVHTNLDAHPEGTNTFLARQLGVTVEGPLVPHPDRPDYGMGRIGKFHQPITISELLDRLYQLLKSPLRFTAGNKELVQRIAIVAGSGRSFLREAIASGVDAFITADLKYHDFHSVDGQCVLVDVGHYEMEQFVPVILENFLQRIVPEEEVEIYRSTVLPNPVRYYPQTRLFRQWQAEVLIK